MKHEYNNYLNNFKEIGGYNVLYEIAGFEISAKHIYVENEEQIGNYCIIISDDDLYYLGEVCENKLIICWAKFSSLKEAYDAL